MFRPLHTHRPPRRGTSFVLIVVVMLSLFSAVGTAFALYAMQNAKLNRINKQTAGSGVAPPVRPPNPDETINRFFSALIYDVGDDSAADLTNAMRGQSMARSMYGRDAALFRPGAIQPPTTSWAGIGVIHEDAAAYGYPTLTGDRAQIVNHTVMTIGGVPFLVDPEYMNVRPRDTAGNLLPFDPATRTYFPKAAGYSFPDLKDFFAADVNPATGEVMVPSFFRDWVFRAPGMAAADQTLGPTNPYWFNELGRLRTLRPIPLDHPQFPRIAPDADGVYRGDVRNLPGGYRYDLVTRRYIAINDSLWMNLNLPVIPLPGNRKVQPVVAPLIIPLNGLFNASVHGNTYFAGAHGSYHGFGPWEVNMGVAIPPAEAVAIANARGLPRQRWQEEAAVPSPARRFNPYRTGPFSSDALVAWGNAGAPTMAYPTGNNLSGRPTYSPGFTADNVDVVSHPALFNPAEWPGVAARSNRVFPLGDAKRFLTRFAGTPDWYSQSELAPLAQTGLRGNTAAFPYTIATGQRAIHSWRLDPSHPNRFLFAPYTYDLDRPKVFPNFPNRGALSYDPAPAPAGAGQLKPVLTPAPYPSPLTTPVGPLSDFTAQNRWSNAMARLGAVDLNRPLTDYRSNPAVPLSAASMNDPARVAQADADRQALARDIFVRLAVAMGAAIHVDTDATGALRFTLPDPANGFALTPPGGTPVPVSPQQYNALRYVAQLAANMVDYIDDDDVSTVVVWNRNPAGTANFADATDVSNRVVFGHEKPRLVINESYMELVNNATDQINDPDPTNPMMPRVALQPAEARCWVELVNPTSTLTPNTGPMGDGSVALGAYQIQITRARRTAGAGAEDLAAYLTDPSNVTGRVGNQADTLLPDATFTFPATPAAGQPSTVAPNNGAYTPNPASLPTGGFVLVGPPVPNPAKMNAEEFAPAAGVWQNMVTSVALGNATASQGMGYTFPLPDDNATLSDVEFKRHVVLLRRLVNPYAPFNQATNPYITVDVMDYVPAFDAVHRGKNNGQNRGPRDATNNTGYDPVSDPTATNNRFSVGKVQPYAGRSFATPQAGPGRYNSYTFPQSMVLRQSAAAAGQPLNTFGRHNGTGGQPTGSTLAAGPTLNTETIMTPFDWMVHLDRPLINTLELMEVRDTPSYRVTDQFVVAAPTATNFGISYDAGYAPWLDDGFARGLEFLSVKSHSSGVAHGGRVPGRMNVNAMNDRRLVQGLFDAPDAGTSPNGFDATFVNDTAWTRWLATRSGAHQNSTLPDGTTTLATTAPAGQSILDANSPGFAGAVSPLSRPFLPLSAPAATANPSAPAFGGGGGLDHTVFRGTAAAAGTPRTPLLYTGATAQRYLQTEALRKIANNTTTVNHQYLVIMTIGYFDVVGNVQLAPGYSIPQLGKEAFIDVPGDMRQKVVAVVDMSQMALKPQFPDPAVTPPDTNPQATQRPFFTTLEQTTYANPAAPTAAVTLNMGYSRIDNATGNLYVPAPMHGPADTTQEVAIAPGSKLVLGYGVEEQVVTVQAILGVGATGAQVSVTADNGVFRTAWGGTCVSNVRPGYPGPQPGFSYSDPKYKGVLPYVDVVK